MRTRRQGLRISTSSHGGIAAARGQCLCQTGAADGPGTEAKAAQECTRSARDRGWTRISGKPSSHVGRARSSPVDDHRMARVVRDLPKAILRRLAVSTSHSIPQAAPKCHVTGNGRLHIKLRHFNLCAPSRIRRLSTGVPGPDCALPPTACRAPLASYCFTAKQPSDSVGVLCKLRQRTTNERMAGAGEPYQYD